MTGCKIFVPADTTACALGANEVAALIAAIAGEDAREGTRERFREKLRAGEMDDVEIEDLGY